MTRFRAIAILFCVAFVAVLLLAVTIRALWTLILLGIMLVLVLAAFIAFIVVARNFRKSFRG
jgi:hypothetical protein